MYYLRHSCSRVSTFNLCIFGECLHVHNSYLSGIVRYESRDSLLAVQCHYTVTHSSKVSSGTRVGTSSCPVSLHCNSQLYGVVRDKSGDLLLSGVSTVDDALSAQAAPGADG